MIRLLVVDDSPLMRRLLGDLFRKEGDFTVTIARDGEEALAQLDEMRPDVITLDVQMPGIDGLECLDRIMVRRPTPVVIASSVTATGAREAVKALQLGAVDVIAKPSGAVSLKMDEFGPQLVEKVRAAANARLPKALRLRDRVRAKAEPTPIRRAATAPRRVRTPLPSGSGLVLVGASTGGPPALDAVLGGLPAEFPWPVVVAQHMPGSFTAALARRLNKLAALTVVEVSSPIALEPGHVYIGRGDADLLVTARHGVLTALSAPASPSHRWHPSADRLVDSAMAHVPASRLVGVLMTGMGNDGAAAMTRLREAGGQTVAEAEATAVVWGMPGELVRAGGASHIEELPNIAARVCDLVGQA